MDREVLQSELGCPRCQVPLFSGATRDVSMLGCGRCGGIWLDNDSAQRVVDHFDDEVARLANRASAHATRPNVRAAVTCPTCRTEMKRRQMSGIEIDYCSAHGTWFDAGELSTLLAAQRPPPAAVPFGQGPAPNFEPTSTVGGDMATSLAGDAVAGVFGVLLDILTD